MALLITIVVILMFAGVIWLMRPQPATRTARGSEPARGNTAPNPVNTLEKLRSNKLFQGVAISRPGCDASRRLMNKQYSFTNVPKLPLPGCNAENCTCQYIGLKDRRGRNTRRISKDRREELRFDASQGDRRSRAKRRRDDKWDTHS